MTTTLRDLFATRITLGAASRREWAAMGTAGHGKTTLLGTGPTSALETQLARYLATRGHSLSTAALSGTDRLRSQAAYVLGEARELRDAVDDAARERPADLDGAWWLHARHELADVVLSAAVLARFLGTSVEACIAEKTEADRGRG